MRALAILCCLLLGVAATMPSDADTLTAPMASVGNPVTSPVDSILWSADSIHVRADTAAGGPRNSLVVIGSWLYGSMIRAFEYVKAKASVVIERFRSAFKRMLERRSKSKGLLRVPLPGSD